MKYDALLAVAEKRAVGIPAIAFEIFRVGGAFECRLHLLARDLWRIVSPLVFVFLLQYVFLFRHFNATFLVYRRPDKTARTPYSCKRNSL